MQITRKIFAGSYYYVAHTWYDGMLFLSPDALHRIAAMYAMACIFAYAALALTVIESFRVWAPFVLFVLVEVGFWLFYRRNDRYVRIVFDFLDEQVEAIRLFVWLLAGTFIAFLITVAYKLWEMEHRILNEKFLVPAIVIPLLFLSLVGVALLISKLIRTFREKLGIKSRSPQISGSRMAYWVFVPALVFAIMMTSFVGGFVFVAMLIAVSTYRFAANCEGDLLEFTE